MVSHPEGSWKNALIFVTVTSIYWDQKEPTNLVKIFSSDLSPYNFRFFYCCPKEKNSWKFSMIGRLRHFPMFQEHLAQPCWSCCLICTFWFSSTSICSTYVWLILAILSAFSITADLNHRWELPVLYYHETMVIYHYVERIWRILVTPNFLYNINNHEHILSRCSYPIAHTDRKSVVQ